MEDPVAPPVSLALGEAHAIPMQDSAWDPMITISHVHVPAPKKKRGRPRKLKYPLDENLQIPTPVSISTKDLPAHCSMPSPSEEENSTVEQSLATPVTSFQTLVSGPVPAAQMVESVTPLGPTPSLADAGIMVVYTEKASQRNEKSTLHGSQITSEQQSTHTLSPDTPPKPAAKKRRGRPPKNQMHHKPVPRKELWGSSSVQSLSDEVSQNATVEQSAAAAVTMNSTQVISVHETAPAVEVGTITPLAPTPSRSLAGDGTMAVCTGVPLTGSQTVKQLTSYGSQVSIDQQSPNAPQKQAVKKCRGRPPKNQVQPKPMPATDLELPGPCPEPSPPDEESQNVSVEQSAAAVVTMNSTQATTVSEVSSAAEVVSITPLAPAPTFAEEVIMGIYTGIEPTGSQLQTDEQLPAYESQVTIEQQLTPASSPNFPQELAVKENLERPSDYQMEPKLVLSTELTGLYPESSPSDEESQNASMEQSAATAVTMILTQANPVSESAPSAEVVSVTPLAPAPTVAEGGIMMVHTGIELMVSQTDPDEQLKTDGSQVIFQQWLTLSTTELPEPSLTDEDSHKDGTEELPVAAVSMDLTQATFILETTPAAEFEVVSVMPSVPAPTIAEGGIMVIHTRVEPIASESETDLDAYEQLTSYGSQVTIEEQLTQAFSTNAPEEPAVNRLPSTNHVQSKLATALQLPGPCPDLEISLSDKESENDVEQTPVAMAIPTEETTVTVVETAPADHDHEMVSATPLDTPPSQTESGITAMSTEKTPTMSQTDGQLTLLAPQVTIEQQLAPPAASFPDTSSEPVVKRKRGGPPKNQTVTKSSASVSSTLVLVKGEKGPDPHSDPERIAKRPRGRPKGSKNKSKQTNGPSDRTPSSESKPSQRNALEPETELGAGKTREAPHLSHHLIQIRPGEDVVRIITAFFQKAFRPLYVISACGAVGYVELKHDFMSCGTTTVIQDTRELLTMTGYYVPVSLENESTRSWTSRLSVALDDSAGAVIGGCISGSMIAVSRVQVVVGSLLSPDSGCNHAQDSVQP